MQLIDNQPVKFDETLNACHLDYLRYKQLVELTDVTNYQIKIGDCPLPFNYIQNGAFATNLNGWGTNGSWVWNNGKARSVSNSTTEIYQQVLVPGDFYRVELTVSDLEATDVTKPFSGSVAAILGAESLGIINENGKYVLFGVASGTKFSIKKLQYTNVDVDNIVVTKVNIDHIVVVYDENDLFITELKVSDFIGAAAVFTPEFTLRKDFLTGFIDWTTLAIAAGCYKICLLDSCVNTNFQNYLPNGEFDIDDLSPYTMWTFTPPPTGLLDIDGVQNLVFFGNSLETGNITQDGVKVGCSYTVKLNIVSITGGEVWVQMGTQLTTKWTTAGIKTEVIVPDGVDVTIHFEGTDPVGTTLIRLDYLRIPIATNCYETDFCTPIFDVKAVHPCTLRINACNDRRLTDDMGFYFRYTNFTPTIRVYSKLVSSQYDIEKQLEEDGRGKRKLVYFKRRKHKKLKISRQPEYVHDFLSLLHGFDHWFIGAIEYSVQSDSYLLTYEAEDNIARVDIDITEKVDFIRNTLCLSEGDHGGCPIEDAVVTTPDDGPIGDGPFTIVEPISRDILGIPA